MGYISIKTAKELIGKNVFIRYKLRRIISKVGILTSVDKRIIELHIGTIVRWIHLNDVVSIEESEIKNIREW